MGSNCDQYILAKFDVSGIQDYIFATNRLRENAGASCQVTRILEEFLIEAFREAAFAENTKVLLDWKEEDEFKLPENENIAAEILYIGGGNGVALFRHMSLFRKVGEKLGIRAAADCQGICLAAAYIMTDLTDFAKDRGRLEDAMNRVKRSMVRQPLYSSFPVVEQDNLSYQPITRRICYKEGIENLTEIQFQKRKAYEKIHDYKRLFPTMGDGAVYGYPEEMDQLCKTHGENSLIAIIHIDGNGMGERVNQTLKKHTEYSQGVPAIRRESKEISELFNETYAEVLKTLWDRQIFTDGKTERLFPLRPILLDGDDFTLLCRADLAIPVAAGFMMRLMKRQHRAEQTITACAGIAFIHSHFPFHVAYKFAEDACSKAKEAWYLNKKGQGGEPVCYLDFQVIKGSDAGMPERKHGCQKRPYSVRPDSSPEDQASLNALYGVLKSMEDWPSGRLHKIYCALLEDKSAIERLKLEFTSRGYSIDGLAQGDWRNSPLFDALELVGLCRLDLLKDYLEIRERRAGV